MISMIIVSLHSNLLVQARELTFHIFFAVFALKGLLFSSTALKRAKRPIWDFQVVFVVFDVACTFAN